jgi:hypothetical protein
MNLLNVGILPQHYMASKPRRPRLASSRALKTSYLVFFFEKIDKIRGEVNVYKIRRKFILSRNRAKFCSPRRRLKFCSCKTITLNALRSGWGV